MSTPAVTVLMPVLNGERFVHQAIASILRQTWTDFEFVIVDDGSSDGTPGVIASFDDPRIRVITNRSPEGLSRSLNRGLAAARAPFVARQDADDIAHPKRLEVQLAFLRSNADVVLLGAQVRVRDARGALRYPPAWQRALTGTAIRFQSLFVNPFIHSTVVFRRDVVRELGGYDPAFISGEDFDLWSRVAERYPVQNLPWRLVDFRMHPSSTAARFGCDHIARAGAVFERNMRGLLALTKVPEQWSGTMAVMQVNPGLHGELDGGELLDILTAIHHRYRSCHPDAGAEIREIIAARFAHVACLLADTDRRVALRAFSRALRLDIRSASAFTTRLAAHLVLRSR